MIGEGGGATGIDNDIVATHNDGIGATIMGLNMFGPVRGAWPDHDWTVLAGSPAVSHMRITRQASD
ncbi:hypothetical protein [Nocardia cyriacigeorgica]|uniref:hypothetical protein n=1 Tax=Nocardia cyriacigeorgica TaxID=135487 RepID=UPI0024572FC6|nr:hypothetical protein [Nocardia cyriacigeorgica]